MQLKFPLQDVKIEITQIKKEVDKPLYDDGFYKLNQNEFSMDVEGVGSFYASGGNYIALVLNPKATQATIELYLNGSTYGAILHQRKIMPMHGSCFVYNNKGVMLSEIQEQGNPHLQQHLFLMAMRFWQMMSRLF